MSASNPTKEQTDAAKALLARVPHVNKMELLIAAETLLDALEAAEADSARLDWLEERKGVNDGNCDIRSESLYVMHVPSGHDYYKGGKNLPLREAIDAARKAQP